MSFTTPVTPQVTSDPTELLCEATDILNLQDGRLGATWSYTKNTPGDASQSAAVIASLNERGVLVPGDVYKQRLDKGEVAVSRSGPNTFKMRLLQTQDEDMGFYSCAIVAWTPGRQDQWNKVKEVASTPVAVSWTIKSKNQILFASEFISSSLNLIVTGNEAGLVVVIRDVTIQSTDDVIG